MRIILAFCIIIVAAPVAAGDLARGKQLYALHCAACHGTAGLGDGPMADVLTQTPADLTRLSPGSDTEFPTTKIVRQIDGTDQLPGHGGAMPVYGYFFEGEPASLTLSDGQKIETTSPIADLVTWLAQLQQR